MKQERSGTFVGTPNYTSPEMLQDSISGTFTDLWSLGVIIYQIFEGKCPWTGNGVLAMFENIINKEINFSKDIHPDAKDLICKLLIKEDPL